MDEEKRRYMPPGPLFGPLGMQHQAKKKNDRHNKQLQVAEKKEKNYTITRFWPESKPARVQSA